MSQEEIVEQLKLQGLQIYYVRQNGDKDYEEQLCKSDIFKKSYFSARKF